MPGQAVYCFSIGDTPDAGPRLNITAGRLPTGVTADDLFEPFRDPDAAAAAAARGGSAYKIVGHGETTLCGMPAAYYVAEIQFGKESAFGGALRIACIVATDGDRLFGASLYSRPTDWDLAWPAYKSVMSSARTMK